MVVSDDGFEPYWTDETDWVVEVIGLPDDLPDDDRLERLNWIGRVAAFAAHTNTRLLAQVGDPYMPSYELWFSFSNDEAKQKFLDLVREDGWADPDEEESFSPPEPKAFRELGNLRPPALVFPKEEFELITGVTVITLRSLETPSDA